jgi:DNA-binding XRE family transcriptional regulator
MSRPKNTGMVEVGHYLHDLRHRAGRTMDTVARDTGIGRSTICRIESGRECTLTSGLVYALALGADLNHIAQLLWDGEVAA